MKNLPTLKFSDNSPTQREFLKEWLTDWNIQTAASQIADEDEYIPDGTTTKEQIARLKGLVNPFDANVSNGEIRILSTAIVPDSDRPYYIAVIKEWEEDMMLIAPYAPFTVPATTGELLTGRDHFSLANLELWNARTVPTVLLRKSWLVDELSKEECDEAFAVFANITSGKELPENLTERIGLPIVNPKDPRIEYQNMESELLAPLLQRTQTYENFLNVLHEDKKDNIIPFINFAQDEIKFDLAASSDNANYSKCIFMKKTISELLHYEMIQAIEEECGSIIEFAGVFESINPEYKNIKLLQWTLEDDINIDGEEFVFAFDIVTQSLIGTGNVIIEDDEKRIDITSITYSSISRTIEKETDIMLVVIKF
jgi:hypothetical protein